MYNHQKTKKIGYNRPHWWFHDFSWWFCLPLEIIALFVRPSLKNLGRPFGPAWDLGPWGTFQRAVLQSGLTTKHMGFIGISPTRIREMGWEYVCFVYSKMTLLSIQATEMPFQWIHSMDRCERGHGGHKKASGVPNIWRRLEHCMDQQSHIPT